MLLSLLSEPAGAAAGVAYMMTLVLSSPAVDPATLAPKVGPPRALVESSTRRAWPRRAGRAPPVCASVALRSCRPAHRASRAASGSGPCTRKRAPNGPPKRPSPLSNFAHQGTILNAEKAEDSRGRVRVPFTQIIPTALDVIDFDNDGSSGAGWQIGKNGLPKLPITSVLAVVGVGAVILEAASHAPVLSLFMPRVLSVAGWLAAAGYLLDKRPAPGGASSR